MASNAMNNNSGTNTSSSSSTTQLDEEARRAINLGLCEYPAAQMLTDAGRAAQKARYVGGEKPVRKPVDAHEYPAAGKEKGK
ncbi:MAG: hypothetical protein LQ352_006649 [Teloschistes flavicans]|nr:MAG: hypothetical protein LQ352_006649 [Teloschistes flavicans]